MLIILNFCRLRNSSGVGRKKQLLLKLFCCCCSILTRSVLTLCCLLKLFGLWIALLLFHIPEQSEDQFCSVFYFFCGFVVVAVILLFFTGRGGQRFRY